MNTHQLLGQLSGLQQMMVQLMESVDEYDGYRSFAPAIPPMAWLMGRAVYLETYWVREVVQGDDDMTARVRQLFGAGVAPESVPVAMLPGREHLLNWALELQDENLMRLANPATLPDHPLLAQDRLLYLILEGYGRNYELMLAQLTERQLQQAHSYEAGTPMAPCAPSQDHADIHQGHFRIGAKDDPAALDNELPTQIVELHGFRIDKQPVQNGAYLAFMEAGGYQEQSLWTEQGWQWRQGREAHPHHWRLDRHGQWYAIGLNGPFDLLAEDAVAGISQHEALAYAQWVSTQGDALAGAVLQHEYQWEVAARAKLLEGTGRVWEWCANPFHAYSGYRLPSHLEEATRGLDSGEPTLRGASLHTQPLQRRLSYRQHAAPGRHDLFSGARLVFPASKLPWE